MASGLYVHIPVCRHRCSYCDFYAEIVSEDFTQRLIPALLRECELRGGSWQEKPFDSVYLGGGTPSALGADRLVVLLDGIRSLLPITTDAEWTIEVNPDSATPELLRGAAACGVNRCSIGVQSFDDHELDLLGRLHDAEGAIETIGRARESGIAEISCDLIYGIPGPDSEATWERTLRTAIAGQPNHISCYLLTLEPHVPLTDQLVSQGLTLPGDETCRRAYARAARLLEGAGYERYEISNWARPGSACRHHMNVWRSGTYLGLGPGAHSYDGLSRSANRPDLSAYLEALEAGRVAPGSSDPIGARQMIEERLLLGLRLTEGVEWGELEGSCGKRRVERLRRRISDWTSTGLVEDDGIRIRIGNEGLFVSNAIIAGLIERLWEGECESHSFMTG